MRYKLLIFLLITIIPSGKACGWWPMVENYRFSLFQPHDHYHREMHGLCFSSELWKERNNSEGIIYDQQLNLDSWQKATGHTINDIREVLYHISFPSILNNTELSQKNAFVKWLNQKENSEWLKYILFIKESENILELQNDPWEEDRMEDMMSEKQIKIEDYQSLKFTIPFLQKRYAFVLIRRSFYLNDNDFALKLFEEHFLNKRPTDIIDYWARYYAGILYRKNNQSVLADQLLAECFLFSADKRIACMEHSNIEELENSLRKTVDPFYRYAIQCLILAKNPYPNGQLLSRILEYDPRHSVAEALVTREINKLEDLFLTERVSGFSSFLQEKSRWYESSIKKFKNNDLQREYNYTKIALKQIVTTKKQAAFYQVALLHVQALSGDTVNMKLQTPLHLPDELRKQFRLTQWFAESRKNNNSWEVLENGYPVFRELPGFNNNINQQDDDYYFSESPSLFHMAIAWLYKHAHENNYRDLAALSIQNTEANYSMFFEASIHLPHYETQTITYLYQECNGSDALRIDSLLNSSHDEFPGRKWLCQKINRDPLKRKKYSDWCGTLLLREKKFREALQCWKNVPTLYWKQYPYSVYLDADPFEAHIGNMHKTDKALFLTKPQIVNRYLFWDSIRVNGSEIQQETAIKKLAAYHYNTSFFGNSWLLTKAWKTEYHEPFTHEKLASDYYFTSTADSLFSLLYSTSKLKETKAFALGMKARIYKNKMLVDHALKNNRDWSWLDNFIKKEIKNPYLDQLFSDYKKTRYVKNLFESCGGRQEFLFIFRHQLF